MSPMAQFDITDPLPRGTVLLEASAGTGKTWTIAALVARYVAEGVATLPQMLIVTFGRAASQELRARVREQLVCVEEALAAALNGQAPSTGDDPLLTHLLDADAAQLRQRHTRIRSAVTHFDAATIATTHQFCQQVLRSLGVAGASDAGASLVENLDDLLVEVVDDLYLRGFRGTEKDPFLTRSEALKIARTAVDDIHAELRPTAAEDGSEPARRVRFAASVREEFDLRKRRLQVMHYNDLLTQLAEALEPPDSPARERMRRRWQVVLVDEFQDTDPIQWQVLERAFAGHAEAMVLIGDPKQAIYAFRGGDVVTYLAAASTATDKRTLPRNYRSDAAVVDALGVLLQGAALGDPEITVHEVSAHRSERRLLGAPGAAPVRLRQVLRDEHLHGRKAISAVRAHIAKDLAHDVAALLASDATFDGRPIQPKDIAVIAFANRELMDAQRELRALGIPAVSAGGPSVLQSPAARDWLALLEAMAAPHRSTLTRAAAVTDLLGHDVATLDAMTGSAADTLNDDLAQRCRDLAAVYARQGIAAVLEVLTTAGLSARVLAQVGGERTLTDLRHVAQILHDTARRDDLGLVALLSWLRAAMAEDAPGASGTRTRRLDSDAAAVQLVTIHGSKGLQYPVVYLPSLASRWISDTPDIPLFHEPAPERTRCIDVGGKRANPTWSEAVTAHKAEDAGESLRLLYVALTRAQSQVVMWWAPGNNTVNSALHRVLFGRARGAATVPDRSHVPAKEETVTNVLQDWADAGAFALESADIATRAAPPAPEAAPVLRLAQWDRVIDQDWRRTSYTALSAQADSVRPAGEVSSEPEVAPRADEPTSAEPIRSATPALPGLAAALPGSDLISPMADLPVGATFGSLVHAVLEHADPQAPDLREEFGAHIDEQLLAWPVRDLDSAALAEALVTVSETPLGPLARGVTLRDIAASDRLCELDFELPLAGGDRHRGGAGPQLGDLAPLLTAHLPQGDPVRTWASVLATSPDLAQQPLRGYLTGSIDVVLRTGGRYLVVDYKTNWLGPIDEPLTAASYRPEVLTEAMGHSSYPLQALLYAVVAHRFLRWRLRDYDPARHLGGVLYLYVRGMCGPDTPVIDGDVCGVFSWQPPVDLVIAVSDLLDGRGSRLDSASREQGAP
ncbi:MAG: UvrD-helicase domain-containing protein [Actinomycetia bacterium]|nr:UvrD-helicase domain-containing protein [Actinomycetes bacterium]